MWLGVREVGHFRPTSVKSCYTISHFSALALEDDVQYRSWLVLLLIEVCDNLILICLRILQKYLYMFS